MNYIAHIQIGSHTQTSLLGNFLGDFIKGSELAHLPSHIELGIRLHRSVDTYTDSHHLIKRMKAKFPSKLRRMSGIVLDIYFDYLLMQKWQQYSSLPYTVVFDSFYEELYSFDMRDNIYLAKQTSSLKTHRWLEEYSHLETCHRAFFSIEKRLNERILFADEAYDFLKLHGSTIESAFTQFYPELLDHGLQFVKSHRHI